MHIDLLSAKSFANGHPHAMYRWLRDNDPVHWHEEPDGPGFWVLTRYADVDDCGRDPKTFSSEPTIMIADPEASGIGFGDKKMMLMMDPPNHTQFRKLVSREFTKGPALAMRERIQELARDIIDKVVPQGGCEFVSQVAGELPSYVIAELMGIPLDDGRELYQLTEILHSNADELPEGAQPKALMEMFGYAAKVYQAKLKQPSNDLASQIVYAELDGERLDERDFQLFFMLLVDAGGDTTRNLVAGGVYELLQREALYAKVKSDLSLIPALRDELLRWVSPVIYMRRTLTQDTQLHGTTLHAGDKVVRYFGAANFDERKFNSPNTLDISRDARPNIAFGSGTHVCLGQHIARIEIDCMLQEVVTRLDNLELAGEPKWLASNFISGIQQMPITFSETA